MLSRSVLTIVSVIVLAIFGAWTYQAYRVSSGQVNIEGLEKEMMPPPGPPTAADGVLAALLKRVPNSIVEGHLDTQERRHVYPWGCDEDDLNRLPSPDVTTAKASLKPRQALREAIATDVVPGLEESGSDCLLNGDHSLKACRTLFRLLAEDFLSLTLIGDFAGAQDLLERSHRLARIIGRGYSGAPRLISKMIELACETILNRAVATALQRGMVPAEKLAGLDRAYVDIVRQQLDLSASVESELDFGERAVTVFDKSIGLARLLVHIRFGDGLEQMKKLRSRWEAGDPPFVPGEDVTKFHPMLQICIPNWDKAQAQLRKSASVHQGVRAAIELERIRLTSGSYPASAPDSVPDPITSKPFILQHKGERWILYGPGPDNNDDGNDPYKDAVVWR